MKSIFPGAVLRNARGRGLRVVRWLPNKGIPIKGKWLLADKKGVTMQLSTEELTNRGYI